MPIYFPSCVVNFRLRFDEAFQETAQPDPTSAEELQNAIVYSASKRQALSKMLAQSRADRTAQDNLSFLADRVPLTATVELPAYRQAGKFNMTFNYRDLPIDPRIVRACGVEIHIGSVSPDDFASGMVSVDPKTGRRRSILRTTDAAGNPRADTLALVGTVDNWTVTHSDKGSDVQVEGRDVRGLLLDSPITQRLVRGLDLRQPIDQVVKQILGRHPFGQLINVFVRDADPNEWPDGKIPSPADAENLTRVRQGADGRQAHQSPQGGNDTLNFWDLITRYCALCGAIPYFIGPVLFVRPARGIFDQLNAGVNPQRPLDPNVPTPFADGKKRYVPGGQPENYGIRRMIYGRDVESLTFERKLGGVKARVVEVVSLDTSSKERGAGKLLVARWPANRLQAQASQLGFPLSAVPEKARRTNVSPAGNESSTDVMRIPVSGIKSQAQLLQIAKSLFEEIGRQEIGGSCMTKSLSSFLLPPDGDRAAENADPDLTRLRPGDAIELRVDTRETSVNPPLVSSYTDTFRRSEDDEIDDIASRLPAGTRNPKDLARAIVRTSRGGILELTKFFRVANVKFTWAWSSGLGVAFDFQNYVVVRSDTEKSNVSKTSRPRFTTPTRSPSESG